MKDTLHITVASVAEVLYDGEGKSILVPSVEGQMQVLKGHAPTIAVLTSGEVKVVDKDGKEHVFRIPGGLFETSHNTATVLIKEANEQTS